MKKQISAVFALGVCLIGACFLAVFALGCTSVPQQNSARGLQHDSAHRLQQSRARTVQSEDKKDLFQKIVEKWKKTPREHIDSAVRLDVQFAYSPLLSIFDLRAEDPDRVAEMSAPLKKLFKFMNDRVTATYLNSKDIESHSIYDKVKQIDRPDLFVLKYQYRGQPYEYKVLESQHTEDRFNTMGYGKEREAFRLRSPILQSSDMLDISRPSDLQRFLTVLTMLKTELKIKPAFRVNRLDVYVDFSGASDQDKNLLKTIVNFTGLEMQKKLKLSEPMSSKNLLFFTKDDLGEEGWQVDAEGQAGRNFVCWRFPVATLDTAVIATFVQVARHLTDTVREKDPYLATFLDKNAKSSESLPLAQLLQTTGLQPVTDVYTNYEELVAWYQDSKDFSKNNPQWARQRDVDQLTISVQQDDLKRFKTLVKVGVSTDWTFDDVDTSSRLALSDVQGIPPRNFINHPRSKDRVIFYQIIRHGRRDLFRYLQQQGFKVTKSEASNLDFQRADIEIIEALLEKQPELMQENIFSLLSFTDLLKRTYEYGSGAIKYREDLALHDKYNFDIEFRVIDWIIKKGFRQFSQEHIAEALRSMPRQVKYARRKLLVVKKMLEAGTPLDDKFILSHFNSERWDWGGDRRTLKPLGKEVHRLLERAYKKPSATNTRNRCFKLLGG